MWISLSNCPFSWPQWETSKTGHRECLNYTRIFRHFQSLGCADSRMCCSYVGRGDNLRYEDCQDSPLWYSLSSETKDCSSLQTLHLKCHRVICMGQNKHEKQHSLTTNKHHRMLTSYCRLPEMLQSGAKWVPYEKEEQSILPFNTITARQSISYVASALLSLLHLLQRHCPEK